MKLTAIINTHSGSVPDNGVELFRAEMDAHGWPCSVISDAPDSLSESLERCREEDCDAFVVWGGDGTVSSVMQALGPDGPPVLPLPGGTMNMLHQRVHGGIADWQTCLVEAVLRRRPEIIPAVRVNDKLVFIGAMIGRLTGLAKARETIRDGDLASLPETLDLQDNLDLTSSIKLSYDGEDGPGRDSATALGVFVTEDKRKPEFGIDLVTSDPQNLSELVSIGFQALTKRLSETPGVSVRAVQSGRADFADTDSLPGTLDGEPVNFSGGLTFEYVPRAARVLGAGLS